MLQKFGIHMDYRRAKRVFVRRADGYQAGRDSPEDFNESGAQSEDKTKNTKISLYFIYYIFDLSFLSLTIELLQFLRQSESVLPSTHL